MTAKNKPPQEMFPIRTTAEVIADFDTDFRTPHKATKEELSIFTLSEFTQPPTMAISHVQNQVIFKLSHGANKDRFTKTIERMKEYWTRGYRFYLDRYIRDELDYRLVEEFDKANN